MPEVDKKEERKHRTTERYYCPPFFSAHISGGGKVEEKASVEDLSLRGMKAKTSCDFEKDCAVSVMLISNYSAPIKFHARVRWSLPPEHEDSSHLVGFQITKIRIIDWLRFIRIIAQIKKEVW